MKEIRQFLRPRCCRILRLKTTVISLMLNTKSITFFSPFFYKKKTLSLFHFGYILIYGDDNDDDYDDIGSVGGDVDDNDDDDYADVLLQV